MWSRSNHGLSAEGIPKAPDVPVSGEDRQKTWKSVEQSLPAFLNLETPVSQHSQSPPCLHNEKSPKVCWKLTGVGRIWLRMAAPVRTLRLEIGRQ